MNPLTIDQPKMISVDCQGDHTSIRYTTHEGVKRVMVEDTGGRACANFLVTDRLDAIQSALAERHKTRPYPFVTLRADGTAEIQDSGTFVCDWLDPSQDLRLQIAPKTIEITTDHEPTDEVFVNGVKYRRYYDD